MWRVTAVGERGEQRPAIFMDRDQPYSLADAYRFASEEWGRFGLDGTLEQMARELRFIDRDFGGRSAFREEQQNGMPGRDSIGTWNRLLETQEFSVVDRGERRTLVLNHERDGLGVTAQNGDARSVIRHDRTMLIVLVPPGTMFLDIAYRSTSDEAASFTSLRRGARSPIAWIESRSFLGGSTGTILGLHTTTPISRIPSGWERARVIVAGASGIFTATMVRTAGKWAERLDTDPMFASRLNFAVDQHHRERQWPELTPKVTVGTQRMWVLVHGTLSTCYGAFEGLPHDFFKPDGVFRFEHDTCGELDANVNELSARLLSVPDYMEIVLLAHSRGGIVARAVGARLRDHAYLNAHGVGYPPGVRVLTFGTPHLGTPLIQQVQGLLSLRPLGGVFGAIASLSPDRFLAAALRWAAPAAAGATLSLLARMGIADRFGVSNANATLAATAYAMLRAGRLPAGIFDMREKGSYLATLSPAWKGCASWGGKYDLQSDPDGFGVSFNQGLSGQIFDGRANDLVIPTDSALAFGDQTVVDRCSHSGYFARSDVQAALKAVQRQPPLRAYL